jgi:peptidoglycan/LPS O-acetylase OafA/YrhL
MSEPFDILTIVCFLMIGVGYFVWSDREVRTLLQLSICGVTLAVANQLGNNEWPIFAIILIVAALGYALLVLAGRNEPRKG